MEDYTPEFELFWKKYPSRWNHNLHKYVKRKKYPAFLSWQKLSPEIHKECLFKARYIKEHEGVPRDCVTWLNQRGWDDIEIDVPDVLPKEIQELYEKALPNTIKLKSVNVNAERNRQRKGLGIN